MKELERDSSCVPYPRKRSYWAVTLPFLVLLTTTAAYLWRCSELLAVLYVSCYVLLVLLHGYVCAFSGCPYRGSWCPGAFATFPVGKIAQTIDRLGIRRSHNLIAVCFGMCLLFLLGILLLPLYWFSQLTVSVAIIYFLLVALYSKEFLLRVCPHCAMRSNCPAAKLVTTIKGDRGSSVLERGRKNES